jgi:hypothetical protein
MVAGMGRAAAPGRAPAHRQEPLEIDGRVVERVDHVVPPAVVPVQHRWGRTVGLLVTDAEGTRWQRTADLEGLARLAVVGATLVGVAAATRRPSARVDRLDGAGGLGELPRFPRAEGGAPPVVGGPAPRSPDHLTPAAQPGRHRTTPMSSPRPPRHERAGPGR